MGVNLQAPGLHLPPQLFLRGCGTLCASEWTERKPEVQSRREKVLDKEDDFKSYKVQKQWAGKSLCPSSSQPVTRKAWHCRHFPVWPSKGTQQKVSFTPHLLTSFYLALQPLNPAFYENFLATSRSGCTQGFCPKSNISPELLPNWKYLLHSKIIT